LTDNSHLPSPERLEAILRAVSESLGASIRLEASLGPSPEIGDGQSVDLPQFGLRARIQGEGSKLAALPDLIKRLAAEVYHQEQESLSLTQEIVDRYEQLAILFEMSDRLGQAENFQAKSLAILETALESVGAASGCLLINREEWQSYYFKTGDETARLKLERLAKQAASQGLTSVEEKDHIAMPLAVAGRRLVGGLALGTKAGGSYRSGDLKIISTLAAYAALLLDSERLYADLESLFFNTVSSMVEAIDAKDPSTRGHSERVRRYSLLIAEELGLDGQGLKRLELAALLHDVGKIGLPDVILRNRGDLRPEQWELVKQHPQMGVAILSPVTQLKDILPAIGEHHERYDGQGYPEGKRGEEISLFARIIAVADAFDAMTMERTYRPTFTRDRALQEVRENAGTQFDPQLAEIFYKTYRGRFEPER